MNSDRLNPMVIKELRQGLKSKSFLATFLGLQVAMVLSMFIYLAAASTPNSDLGFADGFFWFMLGLMLLLFMPLRAFQALHEEIKGNTLEMLFLTRMNAWKITFGKWCALVIQIFLLVAAILPYLVLRYFLGTIDVASNLRQLFYQVIISMVLVSVAVGLSGWTSKVMRTLTIIGAFFSLYTLPVMLFGMSRAGSVGPFAFFTWVDFSVSLVIAGLLMMFFVEYGASLIAPPAENHAILKRVFALTMSLVLGLYGVLYRTSPGPVYLGMILLIPVAIDALCEHLIGIQSIYVRLRKLRFVRWLFYPGWVSGFIFVSLVTWMNLLFAFWADPDDEIWILGLVGYNALIWPFFWMRVIPFLTKKPLVSYVAIQIFSFILCMFVVFLDEVHFISNYTVLGHFLPVLGFFVIESEGISDLMLPLLSVNTAIMVMIALLKARRPLIQMHILSRGEER